MSSARLPVITTTIAENVRAAIPLHGSDRLLAVRHVEVKIRIEIDHTAVELTESVEFKSLPSGLHNVEEDLVCVLQNGKWST